MEELKAVLLPGGPAVGAEALLVAAYVPSERQRSREEMAAKVQREAHCQGRLSWDELGRGGSGCFSPGFPGRFRRAWLHLLERSRWWQGVELGWGAGGRGSGRVEEGVEGRPWDWVGPPGVQPPPAGRQKWLCQGPLPLRTWLVGSFI